MIGQLLMLAAIPALARVYGVDAFGAFGIFSTVSLALSVAAAGRFEQAIVPAATDRSAIALVHLSLGVVALVCLVLAGVLLAVLPASAPLLGSAGMVAALYWLPLGVASGHQPDSAAMGHPSAPRSGDRALLCRAGAGDERDTACARRHRHCLEWIDPGPGRGLHGRVPAALAAAARLQGRRTRGRVPGGGAGRAPMPRFPPLRNAAVAGGGHRVGGAADAGCHALWNRRDGRLLDGDAGVEPACCHPGRSDPPGVLPQGLRAAAIGPARGAVAAARLPRADRDHHSLFGDPADRERDDLRHRTGFRMERVGSLRQVPGAGLVGNVRAAIVPAVMVLLGLQRQHFRFEILLRIVQAGAVAAGSLVGGILVSFALLSAVDVAYVGVLLCTCAPGNRIRRQQRDWPAAGDGPRER